MILLEPITTAQTVKFLPNVRKGDLPINGATFEFTDSYSGNTIIETANVVPEGFAAASVLTVELENERRYQLTVKNGDVTIFRDTVWVSNQLETEGTDTQRITSAEGYRVSNGQFVNFNSFLTAQERADNRKVVFNDIR